MNTKIVIHKINITKEARCDVKDALGIKEFNWRSAKSEIEEYITYQDKANCIPWWGYFRCKYYDEKSDKMLMLFFYRKEKISVMQFWDLAGVCLEEDWSEELEDDGVIRNWLKTKIDDLAEEDDWVISYRVNKVLRETTKTKYDNILKEVLDEFNNKRDKETAKELALLQSKRYGIARE